MKNKIGLSAVLSMVALSPVLVFARVLESQRDPLFSGVFAFINSLQAILNNIIPFIITLAVVVLLWGLVQYVTAGGGDKKKEAQGVMLWGVIIIFVMISLIGIVNLLRNAIGISPNMNVIERQTLPQVR
jgi:ribose/xylose/arabinose/galactoside ABC-type transport system permease subunit